MKVIIARFRTITSQAIVNQAVDDSGFKPTEIICGGATGVDSVGHEWARTHAIPVILVTPEWSIYGSSAGPKRNRRMAELAGKDGGLILVWDGKSRGSASMKREANRIGIKIFEVVIK